MSDIVQVTGTNGLPTNTYTIIRDALRGSKVTMFTEGDQCQSRLLRSLLSEEVDSAGGPFRPRDSLSNTTRYPLLSGVDALGRTVFNGKQMLALRSELENLLDQPLPPEERETLNEIVMLCEAGQRRPHHYLWFIGD